jgi:hypothetical protein
LDTNLAVVEREHAKLRYWERDEFLLLYERAAESDELCAGACGGLARAEETVLGWIRTSI